MVMKAQANVYHVKCFACAICNSLLQTGDHFGMHQSKLYCRLDFEQLQYAVDCNMTVSSSQYNTNIISSSLNLESINVISNNCGPNGVIPINGLNTNGNLSPVSIPPTFDDLNFGEYTTAIPHPDFPTHEQQPTNKNQRSRKRRPADSTTNRTNDQWQLGR